MTVKTKCFAIVLALGFFAGSALADKGKSYKIKLSSDSQIGARELPAGDYKLAVHSDDPNVRLTDVKTGEELPLKANVEFAGEKFSTTQIHCDRSGGANRITEIRLGGTKTRVVFQ